MSKYILFFLLFINTPLMWAQSAGTPNTVVSSPNGAQVKLAIASAVNSPSRVIDRRTVTLTAGRSIVRFPNMPLTMDENSVALDITPVTSGDAVVEVLEQRFRRFANPTQKSILRRAVGQTITVLRGEAPSLKGVLLSADETILLETSEGIVINPVGTFVVPRSSELDGIDRVTTASDRIAEWLLDAPSAGAHTVEARYAMTGLAAVPTYQATFTEAGTTNGVISLQGWLTLENTSTVSFPRADISLLESGDYTILQNASLDAGDKKKVSFVRTPNLAVAREWLFPAPLSDSSFLKPVAKMPADIVVKIDNDTRSGLGRKLPGAALQLSLRTSKGEVLGVLQQSINYTGDGDTLVIPIGQTYSYALQREVVRSRQLNPVTNEHTIQFTLTNSTATAREVTVMDRPPIGAKITEAKIGDQSIAVPSFARNAFFTVPLTIPANDKITFTYVVEVKTS